VSAPETPVQTEAVQILGALELQGQRIDALTDALNGLGANVQWIIDNVQGIFQMFSNPAMMAQLSGMMGGVQGGGQNGPDGPAGDGVPAGT
jgi:hypothetical protein